MTWARSWRAGALEVRVIERSEFRGKALSSETKTIEIAIEIDSELKSEGHLL
jgi:hypothetical protein